MTLEELVLRLRGVVDNSINTLQSRMDTLTQRAAQAATVLAVATAALAGVTIEAADTAASVGALAEGLGVSTEALQAQVAVLSRYGLELNDVAGIMTDLTDRSQDALSGMQSFIDDFALIGVEVDDLRGKNPIELFDLFVDRASQIADRNKVATAAVRLLGDEVGTKLLPLLAAGSEELEALREEARALGLVFGGEAAEQARVFQRGLGALQARVGGIATSLGLQLLPVGNRVLAWLDGVADTSAPAIMKAIEVTARLAGAALDFLSTPLGMVAAALAGAGAARGFIVMAGSLFRAAQASALLGPLLAPIAAIFGGLSGGTLVALAAGLLLVVAAIDDIVVGLQGGESFFADMLAWGEQALATFAESDLAESLRQIGGDLYAIGSAIAFVVGAVAGEAWQSFQRGLAFVADLAEPLLNVAQAIGRIASAIASFGIDALVDLAQAAAGRVAAVATRGRQALGQVADVSRSVTGDQSVSGAFRSGFSVTNNVRVEGLTAEQAARVADQRIGVSVQNALAQAGG